MAPPSNLPRLATITPQQVAAHATGLLADHLVRLMFELDPGIVWQRPSPESSAIGFTASLLTAYAQTGRDPEAEDADGSAALAHDRVRDLCAALYSQAGRPGTFETPDLSAAVDGDEPDDVVAVVLVAAWARVGLAEGRALTKRELACLASMSVRQVRALAAKGEIRDADGLVPAEEAKRWLGARGVAGFGDAG